VIKSDEVKLLFLIPIFTLSIFSSVGCSPPNKDGGPAVSGPTTDWKEGYGGDSMAIEVVRHIETICFRTRTMRKTILSSALETEKDVSAEICGLLDKGELSVQPIDQPMVNGVEKDAANYPRARPRRLEIKRSFWTATANDIAAREALTLHEILPLIGLDDADYVRSSRLLLALEAKIGRVTIASCDEKRIEAVYAAGDGEFLKFYTRDLGSNRCEQVVNVLAKHVVSNSFEGELGTDLQHFYIWGIFMELVRAKTPSEMEKLAEMLRVSIVRLPDAFSKWSQGTCHLIAHVPENRPKTCGGFLNVIVGASPTLKFNTMEVSATTVDDSFDRAALQTLGLLQVEPTLAHSKNPVLVNDQLSSSIVQSAIEGQNWLILYYLGHLQRRFNSELRPSDVLLRDINFLAVRKNSPTEAFKDGVNSSKVVPLNRCLPEEIRLHAASILDGLQMPNLVCAFSSVI
jgi:hypothetical protein